MHEIASGKWYSGVDVGEALRYAGVRSAESCPDEMAADAARAVNQVGEAALCKAISRECSLTVSDGICVIDGMEIRSDSLAEHLAGCDRALLFAATLGSGVDLLISRYSTVKMSYAVLLQGAAAALIELYCDSECALLEEKYAEEGCCLLPRFSPGYGDFPLHCGQRRRSDDSHEIRLRRDRHIAGTKERPRKLRKRQMRGMFQYGVPVQTGMILFLKIQVKCL